MAGQPTNRGSIPGGGNRFVSSPQRPGWLSGPPRFLFNATRGVFRRGRRVKMVTQCNLATQLRMTAAVPPHPHTTSWRANGQFDLTLNFPCGASTRFRVTTSLTGLHNRTQWAHHTRQGYSGPVTSPTQRHLPDNTQNQQKTNIHMPPEGFEFAIPTSERSKTRALDRAATGIGTFFLIYLTLVGTVQLNSANATICKCGVNGSRLLLYGMRDQIHG